MFREKFKATLCHFAVTLFIAALTGITTFIVFYPAPYWKLSDGLSLWRLITIIEVILGPLMSFVIYQKGKSRIALITDYSIVGIVQMAALAYGLSILVAVRPVGLVFAADRFEVVTASDFTGRDIAVPDMLSSLGTIATIVAKSPENVEKNEEILMDVLETGIDIHLRPELYTPLEPNMVEGLTYPLATFCEFEPEQQWCQKDVQNYNWGIVNNNGTFWTGIFDSNTIELKDVIDIDPYFFKEKMNKTKLNEKTHVVDQSEVENEAAD